ncbi:hypothetical protein MTO96_008739 [Rhipicephalus appendiculatus]
MAPLVVIYEFGPRVAAKSSTSIRQPKALAFRHRHTEVAACQAAGTVLPGAYCDTGARKRSDDPDLSPAPHRAVRDACVGCNHAGFLGVDLVAFCEESLTEKLAPLACIHELRPLVGGEGFPIDPASERARFPPLPHHGGDMPGFGAVLPEA